MKLVAELGELRVRLAPARHHLPDVVTPAVRRARVEIVEVLVQLREGEVGARVCPRGDHDLQREAARAGAGDRHAVTLIHLTLPTSLPVPIPC